MKIMYRYAYDRLRTRQLFDIEGVVLQASMKTDGGQLETLQQRYDFMRGLLINVIKELPQESQNRIAKYLGFEPVN